jgi:hypothetical protein
MLRLLIKCHLSSGQVRILEINKKAPQREPGGRSHT